MPAKSTTTFSPSSSFSPASPAPSSSYTHDEDDHDDNHESGPARKRARTAGSAKDSSATSVSEQRKEARAHRNRIAAQNSRDRRKAQFAYLERRVAELEEENRRLRAGMPVNPAPVSVPSIPLHAAPTFDPSSIPVSLRLPTAAEDHLRAEREKERERENEELKERIKTLERGWDAVVKALAAQGVAAGIFNVAPPQSSPSSAPAPAPVTPAPAVSTQPSFTAFPSPAPSHSSLEYDLSSATTTSPTTSPSVPTQSLSLSQASAPTPSLSQPTRHLARVATTGGPSLVRSPVSLQRVDSETVSVQVQLVQAGIAIEGTAHGDEANDRAMEALFREILTSPRAQSATVPVKGAVGTSAASAQVVGTVGEGAVTGSGGVEEMKEGVIEQEKEKQAEDNNNNNGDVLSLSLLSADDEQAVADWTHEIEMQQMLDSMIMGLNEGNELEGQNLGLNMGMGMMDMGNMNMDMGLDNMAMEMNFDAGLVDYTGVGWGGASVF